MLKIMQGSYLHPARRLAKAEVPQVQRAVHVLDAIKLYPARAQSSPILRSKFPCKYAKEILNFTAQNIPKIGRRPFLVFPLLLHSILTPRNFVKSHLALL